ncbi:unnamed protein product [Caenorhabditis angaria]|uniref:Agrin n=1 Tax=Caenorhabditis angaria TaxID=860376 RepID=A0A9P1IB48_9PELO|nr:unnamed protein product [Caenorhabditis angaria]
MRNNLVQLFHIFLLFIQNANCYYNCSTPKITRSYLQNLVNEANTVVSANVKSIIYKNTDDINLEIEALEIKPIRFYKSPSRHLPKTITIYNLMKVEPCPYKLLTSEIRVFFLTENDELLAPLIRINLSVLDQLHTISKGKPHRHRRKSKRTVCENSLCPLGSKCDLHSGKCECRSKCRFKGEVVCGNDDVTYSSMCHLAVRSCMMAGKGKRLKMKSKGPCKKRNPCEDLRCAAGEECVVKQSDGILAANCVCPQNCPNYGDSIESSPVCSSHGVDYQSSCHLNHHACESKSNITVKYYGRCDPCHDFTCPRGLMCKLGKDRKPECRCSEQCSLEFSPVCGTDGKTYTNECILNLSSCKENRFIAIWKKGKCETYSTPCSNIQCAHGANCYIKSEDEAECQCHNKCEDVMRPVCATNGETFDNECEMRKRACETSTNLSIKHHGTCGVGVCATFSECKKPKVCEIENGKPKCICPKCTDELKEVCGSDGKTYPNECKLRQAVCLLGTNQNIFVKYNGICEGCESQKCDFYSSCVVGTNGKATCQCPDYCTGEHREVCGTDGVTYSSECHLRKSACHYKKFIVTAFEGKCDACLHVQCTYGQECRNGICICSYNCPENPPANARICGENGVLYPSFCHLQLASCQKGSPIGEMPPTHCHSSIATFPAQSCTCTFGAICEQNQCKCPICDRRNLPYPICGSDGNIYQNQCDLNTISCRDQRLIHVLPLLSQCSQFNDTCQCNRVGSFGHTCDEFGQCKCRPGVTGLKCDHCMSGFWGIHLIAQGALSCTPCGCSSFGAARSDCEQSTGKCECHNGAIGDKCNLCEDGQILTASGCVLASNYKTPRDCSSLKCHHSAKCVPSPSSFPDCICPNSCNLDTLGLIANMTVCGSDGETYSNMCEMKMFACKHQMDLTAVSMGICDNDNLEILGRLGREEKSGGKRLGSQCEDDDDCDKLNARCVTRPGRKSACECVEGSKSHLGKCEEIEKDEEKNGREHLNLEIGNVPRFLKKENVRRFSKLSINLRLSDRKKKDLFFE